MKKVYIFFIAPFSPSIYILRLLDTSLNLCQHLITSKYLYLWYIGTTTETLWYHLSRATGHEETVRSEDVLYPYGNFRRSEELWLENTCKCNNKSKIPLRSEADLLKGSNKILMYFQQFCGDLHYSKYTLNFRTP